MGGIENEFTYTFDGEEHLRTIARVTVVDLLSAT